MRRERRADADQLFLSIPSVANHHATPALRAQASSERKHVEKHLRRYHRSLPPDIFVGAMVDGELIGACLAGANCAQAATVLWAGGWPPGNPDPLWVYTYAQRTLNVESLAVDPDFRRQGVGRALLAAVEGLAAVDPARELRSLTAFASNQEAVRLFAAAGYTVGGPREPIPLAYLEGVRTEWDDMVMGEHAEGRNVYKHPDARLGRPRDERPRFSSI